MLLSINQYAPIELIYSYIVVTIFYFVKKMQIFLTRKKMFWDTRPRQHDSLLIFFNMQYTFT